MSGGVLLQAVISGLAAGAVYGLVALGFTLVYGLTRVLSFAQGDLVSGAIAGAVLIVLGATPAVLAPSLGASVGLVVLTLAIGAGLASLTYALAVRPFLDVTKRHASGGYVAVGILLGLTIREALSAAFPRSVTAVPDPLRLGSLTSSGVVRPPGGAVLPVRLLGVLVLALLIGVGVEQVLVRSKQGKAMRAVADDPEVAELVGIPAGRVVLLAFAVAGLLAGAAALLAVPGTALTATGGVILGLKGIAAALLGRLGSLRGALAGGLLLGVVEQVAVTSNAFGPRYADVLALTLLVVLLAVRPEGLRAQRTRIAD